MLVAVDSTVFCWMPLYSNLFIKERHTDAAPTALIHQQNAAHTDVPVLGLIAVRMMSRVMVVVAGLGSFFCICGSMICNSLHILCARLQRQVL
jgi:hypothetical protein